MMHNLCIGSCRYGFIFLAANITFALELELYISNSTKLLTLIELAAVLVLLEM